MKFSSILPCLFLIALRMNGQPPVEAQQQARITGQAGPGRCLIEVDVDGVAEVYVKDQQGSVRTLAGQPSRWRKLECNQPMPRNPVDFQFRGIDGRGNVQLIHDPARGGVAVVRIEDPKGGSDTYRFALEWRADGGGQIFGGDRYGDRGGDRSDRGDRGDRDGDRGRVVRRCADAVQDRLVREDYQDVRISGVNAEDRPGRRADRVLGRASARGRWGMEQFSFACGVNFDDGSIRGVDVVPQ